MNKSTIATSKEGKDVDELDRILQHLDACLSLFQSLLDRLESIPESEFEEEHR